jgi:WD40 repeat protein
MNWSELGRIVKAFEEAWERGQRPVIEDFLPAHNAGRAAALVELVHTELECRLKAGEAVRVEVYLERYPELVSDTGQVEELIAAEYRQRRRREPDLTTEEYTRRFPLLGTRLAELLEALPVPDTNPFLPAPPGNTLFGVFASSRTPGVEADVPKMPGADAVAGYEILEELGRGGMAVVYKARQKGLNRLVALKMILSGSCAGQEERKRFRIEAEAAAQLQHANIVQIHDVGEFEGRPFLSLELVEGGSLADYLRSAPFQPAQAAALTETLAGAMHYAHQRGILHRDLKPANILLQKTSSTDYTDNKKVGNSLSVRSVQSVVDYLPKITDFGLAKRLDVEAGNTPTGDVLGTPSYMAPEQAQPRGRVLGPEVDVYALGAILYECLTGRPPFRAATPLDTMIQVLSGDPVPPRRLNPKVPRDLETICLRCLHKEPKKRYPSARSLADDLHRFRASEPILARRATAWERAVKWARRRPVVAGLSAALVLVLAGAFGGMFGLWRNAESERRRADAARAEADRQHATADASRQLAEDRLVRLQVATGMRRVDEDDLFGALPWFVSALEHSEEGARGEGRGAREDKKPENSSSLAPRPSPLPPSSRLHRMRLASVLRNCPRLVQFWRHPGRLNCALVSPDGRRVLLAGDDGTARLFDLDSGEAVCAPLRHGDAVVQASFSPDGQRLVTASWDRTARVWDARTGKPLTGPLAHEGAVEQAAFSPDGRLLVTASQDHTARLWDAATGKLVCPPLAHEDEVSRAEFSPDGKHVVTACLDHTARVWEVPAGIVDFRFQISDLFNLKSEIFNLKLCRLIATLEHKGRVHHAAYSADGRILVTASADHTARLWHPATGQPLGSPLKHADTVVFAAFSPDSRLLVTAATHSARLWEAATGRELFPPREHRGTVVQAAFSPDSHRLLTADDEGTVRLWDALSGQPLAPPLKHNQLVASVAFHPDGRRAVTASHDRTARVWDLTPPTSPLTVRHDGEIWHAAFSPDGRRLATAGNDLLACVWDIAGQTRRQGDKETRRREEHRPFPGLPVSLSPCLLVSLEGHTERVMCVAFSPDGRRLATASDDQMARLWDARTGKLLAVLGHDEEVVRVAFSPDGRRLVTASYDGTARIWDAQTGKALADPLKHQGPVVFAAFSPDGRLVVSVSEDRTARLWDAATGRPALAVPLKHTGAMVHAAFSPDGRFLATAGTDRKACVWEVATGKLVCPPLKHRHEVRRVAFSPDSRLVATASYDHTARIWDARTGRETTPPLRHAREVRHVSFSPDGQRVLTAGDDGVARVWDAATGQPVTVPLRHHGPIPSAEFSPDGQRVVTAGEDGAARVWDVGADPRPLADLRLLAQLLTGQRFDQVGGTVFLQAAKAEYLEDAWRKLRAKYPDQFGISTDKR